MSVQTTDSFVINSILCESSYMLTLLSQFTTFQHISKCLVSKFVCLVSKKHVLNVLKRFKNHRNI